MLARTEQLIEPSEFNRTLFCSLWSCPTHPVVTKMEVLRESGPANALIDNASTRVSGLSLVRMNHATAPLSQAFPRSAQAICREGLHSAATCERECRRCNR
jgi:hypothetical protein